MTLPTPLRHALLRSRLLWAALILVGLSACAQILGPRTVEISREDLLQKMAHHFPNTRRVMRLLDVTAGVPQLELDPQQNRVLAVFDLSARELVLGHDYAGTIALSFALRYEPSDMTVRLAQVRVEQVHVDGFPDMFQRALTTMGIQLGEETLENRVVHQFRPEELRATDRMGYKVSDIVVTPMGLAIRLDPR